MKDEMRNERLNPFPSRARPQKKETNAETAEKKEIYQRLLEYRKKNGLGAYEKLADATNGALTSEEIREMALGSRFRIQDWRALGAALPRRRGRPRKGT